MWYYYRMPRADKIFRPHTMQGRVVVSKMSGTGMGSVLLNKGGVGGASSYSSMEDYLHTTEGGRVRPPVAPVSAGVGLGGAIQRKLESLALKPEPKQYRKKPSNISFSI